MTKKGYKHTPEHNANIGIGLLGKQNTLGYHKTDEQRANNKLAQLTDWDGTTETLGAVRRSNQITVEKFWDMVTEQDYTCFMCDGSLHINGPIAVDHDHATGKVRGIAHAHCNWGYDSPNVQKHRGLKETW